MSEENKEKVSVVGEPANKPEEEVNVDSIVDELADEISEDEKEITDAPTSETPAPAINIQDLSIEQIQELAARINAAPTRADSHNKSQTVKLRIYEGKVVTDFGNAYLGLIDDPENNRKVERHIIPVTVQGQDEPIHIKYRDFMQLEQIDCEVIRKSEEDDSFVTGTTYNDNDELVEMKVVRKKYTFELKLPAEYGDKITVDGKVVNA